ncbi:PHP domain-containing protein [Halobacillus sp. B29]|uniref:PHP domain-containing protein n=1 Tax=Halobacillus sp. B29 TaxID=3457432 RepID=UPI003FCDA17C
MIDLHCHTSISDNTMTIQEVIDLAKTKQLTHLAITDHDTTAGLQEAKQLGKQQGIEIIPGIEISAFDYKRNRRAHILGYHVPEDSTELQHLCSPMLKRRHFASYEMVQKLIQAGYPITWEEVQSHAEGSTAVYKQHIMQTLIDHGFTNEIYSPLYKKLFAAQTESGEEGIAYTPVHYLDAIDAIRTIEAAGGIPVLAHPGQFDNFDAIEEWTKYGLKGIEVYHPLHDQSLEKKAIDYAERFNLIITGGSDFHGGYGPSEEYPLGCKSPGNGALDSMKALVPSNI